MPDIMSDKFTTLPGNSSGSAVCRMPDIKSCWLEGCGVTDGEPKMPADRNAH